MRNALSFKYFRIKLIGLPLSFTAVYATHCYGIFIRSDRLVGLIWNDLLPQPGLCSPAAEIEQRELSKERAIALLLARFFAVATPRLAARSIGKRRVPSVG